MCLCERCRGMVANLQASRSVFQIIVKSETGERVSYATAFSVDENAIITNEHAIRGGTPYLNLGTVCVRLFVEKVDSFNDLALLVPDGDISSRPLRLARSLPRLGVRVFALEAPTVSDQSTSTGIVEVIRNVRGRELLQISVSLADGASGGPVLTANGEVIGLAVGISEGSQNISFAIPSSAILRLLSEPKTPNVTSLLGKVDELWKKRWSEFEYSLDADSPFQRAGTEVDGLLSRALQLADQDSASLLAVADKALETGSDLAVRAAERAVVSSPTAEMYVRLARSLKARFLLADTEGTRPTLHEAEEAIRAAFCLAAEPTVEMYEVLAQILEDRSQFSAARSAYLDFYKLATSQGSASVRDALVGLARTSHRLQAFSDSDHWFQALVDYGKTTPWDWQEHAERHEERKDFQVSAECYVLAAEAPYLWKNWCRAALNYSLIQGAEDLTLECARAAIKAGIGRDHSDGVLAHSHFLIASIANHRGAFKTSLSHAREAATITPTEAIYHLAMSEALIGLKRFEEGIHAVTEAIRLSDIEEPLMYFTLGSAYFKSEDWASSRLSFLRAAALDPSDAAAAYNVALCCQRQDLRKEAALWLQEANQRRSARSAA